MKCNCRYKIVQKRGDIVADRDFLKSLIYMISGNGLGSDKDVTFLEKHKSVKYY